MRLSESDAPGRVLVVDDHRDARESMADVLRQAGHQVACCSSAAEALEVVARETFDCVVTDLKMPGMNGVEFIIQLDQRHYGAQVVMVTAHASVSTAVEAMRHGAFDYLEKPFDVDGLERLVSQAIRHGRLVRPLPADAAAGGTDEPPAMVGDSRPMQLLREKIAQIAPTPETVLILGESGTGKELVARAIHAASNRRHGPLVSLNCPVLSAHLMESELFGHERGAFTGADAPRDGRFELAQGGSILLDEVTEIDLGLQAKLLRVLQEKTFERVGSSRTIHADVRVLATTNRDLRGGSGRRAVPRRPLLPPGRGAAVRPAAAGATRGHPAPGRPLPSPRGRAVGAKTPDARQPRRATPGPIPLAGERPRAGKHHDPLERAQPRRHLDRRRPAPLALAGLAAGRRSRRG